MQFSKAIESGFPYMFLTFAFMFKKRPKIEGGKSVKLFSGTPWMTKLKVSEKPVFHFQRSGPTPQ